jgi:hypothetical protein
VSTRPAALTVASCRARFATWNGSSRCPVTGSYRRSGDWAFSSRDTFSPHAHRHGIGAVPTGLHRRRPPDGVLAAPNTPATLTRKSSETTT